MNGTELRKIEEFLKTQDGIINAVVSFEREMLKVQVMVPQTSTLSENTIINRCEEGLGVSPDRILLMTPRPNRVYARTA
ncbi:MAG: hypothetical protein WCG75_05635 [Armatimonadota bacterium]